MSGDREMSDKRICWVCGKMVPLSHTLVDCVNGHASQRQSFDEWFAPVEKYIEAQLKEVSE
jgi:hypothetical protein